MAKINGFKLAAMAAAKKSKLPLLTQIFVRDGFAFANNCDIEVIAPCLMNNGAYNTRGEPLANPAPESDYQGLAIPELYTAPVYEAGDLAALIARVEKGISTEETRYYLNGVFFEFKGGLKLTTCDGHRLLHYNTGKPGADIESFILHRETVKIISSVKGGDWQIRVTPNRLRFVDIKSGLVIITKPIDGSFPDYQRVIPKESFYEKHTGNAKDCLAVIERFAKYGAERSKAIKVHGKNLTMRPPNIAPMESQWPIDCERLIDNDSPIEIGFNAGYLRDMLTVAAMDKGAGFAFMLRDCASPIRVEFPACPGLVGVVMPLRV